MKKKIAVILTEIILSLSIIPLWFIKFFHEVGHFPSNPDKPYEIVAHHYYYSVLDNLSALDCGYLIYISFVLIIATVTLSLLCLKFKRNKPLFIASLILFGVTILSFTVFLFWASTVARGY